MNDGRIRFTDDQHGLEIQSTLKGLGYVYENGSQEPRVGAYGIKWAKSQGKLLMHTIGNKATYTHCGGIEVTELFEPKTKCSREQQNVLDKSRTKKAVSTAAKVVCGVLQHDLFANKTARERENRRFGWLAMVQVIQILQPEYALKSVREALVYKFGGSLVPSKDSLKNWFDVCWTESKYSKAQLRAILYPEIGIGLLYLQRQ